LPSLAWALQLGVARACGAVHPHLLQRPDDSSLLPGGSKLGVSADRDHGRARQRYLRASKSHLVDRLLNAEQAYAAMEGRWLRTADDLLVWIIVVDRLLAGNISPKPQKDLK
jgi:hypothetical protein